MSFKQYGEHLTPTPQREVLAEAPNFVATPTWQASATDPDLLTRELPDGWVWETPEWDDLQTPHTWPHDTLLADGGKVWRNISGVPLTTRPGEFPGPPSAWVRLFVEVKTEPDEPAEPDEWPAWEPWDHVRPLYQIGAPVTHNGQRWVATVGDNHWTPGEYGWDLVTD